METDVDPGQPNSQKEGYLISKDTVQTACLWISNMIHMRKYMSGFKLYVLILCQISTRIKPETTGVDQEIAKGR